MMPLNGSGVLVQLVSVGGRRRRIPLVVRRIRAPPPREAVGPGRWVVVRAFTGLGFVSLGSVRRVATCRCQSS